MQTSDAAIRIRNIAHSTNPILSLNTDRILLDDTRLRDWFLAATGSLTHAYPVRAVKTADGNILRIRTLINDTLDIRYATPGDTITWSANTISVDAKAGTGVDLWIGEGVYASRVDAFWLDADGINIRTARSFDEGHTWGVVSTVATLPAQPTGVLPQLCAPAEDTVIFSDSTVGEDDDGDELTALYVTLKVSGSWITPVLWDMGGQPLGIDHKLTLPDDFQYPSNLSGVEFGTNKVLLGYYASAWRDLFESGLWAQQLANLNYNSATQNLHWAEPGEIFQSVPDDPYNEGTEIYCAFPRLQMVGSEYWIVAIEISSYADRIRYHLCFFRSTDGIHWSDRNYHQGAVSDSDDWRGAYIYTGAAPYDDGEPFVLQDLIYANLVVCDNRTFLIGYDRAFWCESTSLVGVTNSDRQYDLTPSVEAWTLNLPQAPTNAQMTYTLAELPDTTLLAAHRGVRIIHRAGYRDVVYGYLDDNDIQLAVLNIDSIPRGSEVGKQDLQISAQDNGLLLAQWKSDQYWEFFGPQQLRGDQFCDLSSFSVINGMYTTNDRARLVAGIVDDADSFQDDVAVIQGESSFGGIIEIKFNCQKTWTRNHMGIAFQGKQGDNKNYYVILYNNGVTHANKFSLQQVIPRTNVHRNKLYRFRASLQTSATIVLNANTAYWMRVGEWHGHIMAWYSTDRITWTKVIDYTSPATPVASVLPVRKAWWGLVGTQRVTPSGALGQLSAKAGPQYLTDEYTGVPKMIARRIQLGATPSTLKRINLVITQENPNSLTMPDARVMLLTGDATEPDDATDDDNIIFARSASALYFGAHDKPGWIGARGKPNPGSIRLEASQYVWLAVTVNGTMQSGQSYKWFADDSSIYTSGVTKVSTDDGATWSNTSPAYLDMTCSIEVEYDAGRVKFVSYSLATGEPLLTYEDLIHHVAAKAGVLNLTPNSFVEQADMVLLGDGIYWQPQSKGKLGDCLLDADVTVTTTAQVILRSSQTGSGTGFGWRFVINPTAQTISFYGLNDVLLATIEPLVYLPASFHLRVASSQNFLLVYINGCFASMVFRGGIRQEGYAGFVSAGATWTNVRIPEFHRAVEYFNIEAKETARTAIEKLLAKAIPGEARRGTFFLRYDGSLRLIQKPDVDPVDAYTSDESIISSRREDNTRNVITELEPEGNYYAKRWDPVALGEEGRWFEHEDFTDARSDSDAYLAAQSVFDDAKAKSNALSVRSAANYALEREDRITITSTPNEITGVDYIISDLTFEENLRDARANQEVGLRVATD